MLCQTSCSRQSSTGKGSQGYGADRGSAGGSESGCAVALPLPELPVPRARRYGREEHSIRSGSTHTQGAADCAHHHQITTTDFYPSVLHRWLVDAYKQSAAGFTTAQQEGHTTAITAILPEGAQPLLGLMPVVD